MPKHPNLIGIATAIFVAVAVLIGCSKKDTPKPSVSASIVSISKTAGSAADTVIIIGKGFSTEPSNNTVYFNGKAGTLVSATATEIVVIVPPDGQSGEVSVKTGGDTATGPVFTYQEPPAKTPVVVVSLSETAGNPGTPVIIKGSGFSATPSQDHVFFNGKESVVTAATTTEIQTSFPDGGSSGAVLVWVNGVTGIGPEFTLSK